ncbi:SxtJ family membrane protein [Candidatus Pelagibacter sp.]|nr:SxtJ family membrane protein [Candidatus Pelagibacter sp.]
MKFSKTKLPSNKTFGYFFSFIFLIISIYLLYFSSYKAGYIFATLALLFLIISILNSNLLLPLNKLWMRFGILIGMFISPIVLGIIFFGLFTPYALVMKIIGRDELNLKTSKDKSYWIPRSQSSSKINFNQQF